jgi:phosphoglycolate phosphatase
MRLTAGEREFDIDAAIVDLDGTLVDTLGDFVAALNAMLADRGFAASARLPREAVEPMVGRGSENLVDLALKEALAQQMRALAAINSGADTPAPDTDFQRALASYQVHYRRINGLHAVVYPGVAEGLDALRRSGLPLACLTNKPLAFATELLAQKQLDGFFSIVFGGDSFARKKPDPLPLLKTCEALGTTAARTLMLGDSSNDAQAARAAGCPVLLVRYGYNHGMPVGRVDADAFVDSLAELQPGL